MKEKSFKLSIFIFGLVVGFSSAFQNCSPSPQFAQKDSISPSIDPGPYGASAELLGRSFQDLPVLNTYSLYSPTRIKTSKGEKLFVGGWIHPDDVWKNYFNLIQNGALPEHIFGPDKIWFVENPTTNASTNGARLKFGLAVPGYHVNDPTIVAPASDSTTNRSSWLYMYFTMLENRIAEKCRTTGQELINCLIPLHDIGLAVSTDGGTTWTFLAKIIDHNQPPFNSDGGGWTPSAIVEPDGQISLYYASGSTKFDAPLLRRVRLSANGWQRLGDPQAIKTIDFANHTDFVYTNPEVKRLNLGTSNAPDWRYLLIYNNAAQKKILMAPSTNGTVFEKTFVIRESSNSNILTPNIISASRSGQKYSLYYEFAEKLPNQDNYVIKQSFWQQ